MTCTGDKKKSEMLPQSKAKDASDPDKFKSNG
jgi:hypothetical protein